MTIGMQGSWTISVKSKSAAWAQRFHIQGSSNGVDGTYDDTSPPQFVTGAQWGITVENNPTGPISWRQSRHRMANSRVSGGQFLFDIETDDSGGGGDEDFNDLILTCAMPLADSEYVVYGQIKSYTGFCLFNPCFPRLYYVVDHPWQLKELLKYSDTRRILEKLYPDRVKKFERNPPFPIPDPPSLFRPMMIPSGLTEEAGLNVLSKETQPVAEKGRGKKASEKGANAGEMATLALSANTTSGNKLVAQDDLLMLGRIRDRLQLRACEVNPVSQTILRFIEYDRTAAEKLGDPYTGEGNRHTLGTTATDEFGSYIFRFSHDTAQIAEETTDIAVGEDLGTEIRPDLLIQLMESLPNAVMYESAPYYNIPNVKRINMCLPLNEIGVPRTACQGGRAIQALGNLSIITSGTTLHADGTISNTNVTGPIVDHAAWYSTVDLFGCFLDTDPKVEHYILRYRTHSVGPGWSTWNFVNDEYTHPKQQGDGTWQNERIGPDPHVLRVDGPANPKVAVGAYLNIESQVDSPEWQNWHRDRKLQIITRRYQSDAGAVEFRIEGYDASGEKVPGAEDTIRLYIDNTWSEGDIDYVKLGTEDPGACALFELPSAGEPLTVRYRVTDPEGFMKSYKLNVYFGSNTFEPTRDLATGNPVDFSYQSIAPFRFGGTLDETVDPSGYVTVSLQPTDGTWLPSGVDFCAFSFELSAIDRKTNGNSTPGNRILWRELIGISYTPPPTP
jgi:hypothetical protein